MSDPVTNVEIEDVLSSIRKLVSAEDRPAKDTATPERAEPEKLVLTPALRVDHKDQRPVPSVTPADEVAPPDDAPAPDDAASDAQQSEVKPDDDVFMEEERDLSTADTADVPDLAEKDSASSMPHEVSDPIAQQEPQSPDSQDKVDQGANGGRAAIFQRAADTNDEEWEPDDGTDPSPPPTEALAWQDATPDAEAVSTEDLSVDEMEGLAAFVPDPDEPQDEPSGPDLYVEAHDDTPHSDNAFLNDGGMFEDDDAILDEEALRDLVAEIVRQELQGSLGERITRNVRKLVRREIQRALAARELD